MGNEASKNGVRRSGSSPSFSELSDTVKESRRNSAIDFMKVAAIENGASLGDTSAPVDEKEARRSRRRKSRSSLRPSGQEGMNNSIRKVSDDELASEAIDFVDFLATGDFMEKLTKTPEGRSHLMKVLTDKQVVQKVEVTLSTLCT